MGFWTNPKVEDSSPYQKSQWFCDLDTVILATDYWDRAGSKRNQEFPALGARRKENAWMGGSVYKNIFVDGEATFMWVWNNSGADIGVGVPVVRRADQSISTLTSGGTNYATKTAAGLTANKEIGALMIVADNADSAGAAPEGSWGKVYFNDTTTLKFQPDLSVALAVTDDIILVYNSHILAAAGGAKLCDFRGVPVASGGIPDGYMGWVCIEAEAVKAVVAAAGTAITTHEGLIAGTALLTNGSSSAQEIVLAYALTALKTDTVARTHMVALKPNFAYAASA